MPRRKAKLDLTLFPFLSVLSGLIAVMVLFMIVTLTTRVIRSDADQSLAGGGPSAGKAPGRPGDGIDADSYKLLDAQIRVREAELKKRLDAREEIRLQLRELAAALDAKKLERERAKAADPQTGVRLGEPTPVKMIPSRGPGPQKKPVFIEVSSSGYVLHPEKTSYPLGEGKRGGGLDVPALHPDLARALAAIARDGDRYPLLLIHPNGAEAFQALQVHLILTHPKLDVGWEPFAREWLLDNK
jgi:hypothetical protein